MGNQFSHTRVVGCTRTKVSFDCLRRLKLSAIIKILVTNQRFSMGLLWQQQFWARAFLNCQLEGSWVGGGGVICKYLRTRAAKLRKLHAACSMQHVAHTLSVSLSLSLCLCMCFSGDMCSASHSLAYSILLHLLLLLLHLLWGIWPGFQLVRHAAFIGLLHQLDRQSERQAGRQAVAGTANQLVSQSVSQLRRVEIS